MRQWPFQPLDVQTVRITASGCVRIGPCYLVGVVNAPYTTAGRVTIYDGVDANGEPKVTVDALKGTTFYWNPAVPTTLNQGLYAEFTTMAGSVTIQFVPLQQGE